MSISSIDGKTFAVYYYMLVNGLYYNSYVFFYIFIPYLFNSKKKLFYLLIKANIHDFLSFDFQKPIFLLSVLSGCLHCKRNTYKSQISCQLGI